jgi:RNA polymerase sigma factor (sigma-70 family)
VAAVPSIGRASLVEAPVALAATVTEGLFERHAAKIQSYCLHRLGSREEAEDAVQTTFMNAFRALGRGVVPDAEAAWLYKIAENVCLTRNRSSWRRGRVESPASFELLEEVVPAPHRPRDELIGLEEALASMPEQQRRAILLREWQGLSYREVAEELNLSQSAVETLIFRARRSLAQGLEQPLARPRRRLRRALHALDLGPLVGTLKTLLLGGAAAKATVAALAVTAAVSVAGGSGPTSAPAATPKALPPAATSTKNPLRPLPPAAARSVPSALGLDRPGTAEHPVPQLPAPAVAGKAKAAANRAAATPGVAAAQAQFGQNRAAVASQGRSVAATTRRASVPAVSQGQALGHVPNVPPAVVPPQPGRKPLPVQAQATVTPAVPPAATTGGARAAEARDK